MAVLSGRQRIEARAPKDTPATADMSAFADNLSDVCIATLRHRGVSMDAIRAADFTVMRSAGVTPGSCLHKGVLEAAKKTSPVLYTEALKNFPADTPDVQRRP